MYNIYNLIYCKKCSSDVGGVACEIMPNYEIGFTVGPEIYVTAELRNGRM